MENQEGNKNKRFRLKGRISGRLVLIVLVVAALLFCAATSFFVVDQTENAVVLRFGKYVRTVGPGLQTKLPFGIEKNINIPTQRVVTETFGYKASDIGGSALLGSIENQNESRMLTGDLNIVDVEWIVQYYITDPQAWLFNVEDKVTTIRDISQSVMNQLVGDLPILAIMTSERTQIEYEAQKMMQEIFDRYGMGIKLVTVKLQNIVPPEGDVQDAFEDVNKAIQDMNMLINEGKELYNKEIPAAEGEAEMLILQAEGYAADRVNRAKGDASRFSSMLEAYENSPDVTSTRLYIEAVEDVINNREGALTLIDKNVGSFIPFKDLGGAR